MPLSNTAQLLRWFDCSHLPPELQSVTLQYQLLAKRLARQLPVCAETTVALRKLLESKDAAVRAEIQRMEEKNHEAAS